MTVLAPWGSLSITFNFLSGESQGLLELGGGVGKQTREAQSSQGTRVIHDLLA